MIGFSLLSALWLTTTLILIADMNSTYAAFLAALCPVFLMLAPTTLSENLAFFFAVAGIYLLHRCQDEDAFWHFTSIIPAALALGTASLIREPYAILLVGNVAYLLLKRRRAGLLFALSSLPFLLLLNWLSPSLPQLPLSPQLPASPTPPPIDVVAIYAKPKPLSLVERIKYTAFNTCLVSIRKIP